MIAICNSTVAVEDVTGSSIGAGGAGTDGSCWIGVLLISDSHVNGSSSGGGR
jgi:hypothetical protein